MTPSADALARIEALVTSDPPTSPYTDVAEAAMWRVGYTAAQTAVLRVLLESHPDPQPEYDASGLPTRVTSPESARSQIRD